MHLWGWWWDFFLQSKRETMMFYPTSPSETYGVFAIRLEKYKAHFYTQGGECFLCTGSHFSMKAASVLLTASLYFSCIRRLPQRHHPRPRLLHICKPDGPRPPSSVWPGGRSIGALPSLTGQQTWPASSAGKDQESQGTVWRLHGVWRKPDVQRNRPESGTLLQPSVWAQTQLLPLLMGGALIMDCISFPLQFLKFYGDSLLCCRGFTVHNEKKHY